jgi:hypothetical protein
MPEADTSVAAGAEVAPTATDVDAPCGLGARPADTAAWHRAIAEATLRSDTEAVACLRQAMQDAADDAER